MVNAMRFSLRTLISVQLCVAAWFCLFSLYPYFALLLACAVPSVVIVFSHRRSQTIASKLAIVLASFLNLVPLGVLLHACCYIVAGIRAGTHGGFERYWLISVMDRIAFFLVGSTVRCIENEYLLLMNWCFELGVAMQSLR
jgi:hypothetical protein